RTVHGALSRVVSVGAGQAGADPRDAAGDHRRHRGRRRPHARARISRPLGAQRPRSARGARSARARRSDPDSNRVGEMTMSRIQNILEKAEREGGVRRLRSITEPAGATLAVDVPLAVPPVVEEVVAPAPEIAMQPDIRAVRAHLNRALVAALEPGAMAAEQYRALRT